MTSGSQFVSTTATTGMCKRFASVTAMCSFFVSITKITLGSFSRFLMPPRLRSSLARSRRTFRPSFFDMRSTSPESTWRWNSRSLATRECTVWKLVSMLFRADEQHGSTVRRGLAHEPVRGVDAIERLVQIDDVDAVALSEDET